jgi:hypothetical protein
VKVGGLESTERGRVENERRRERRERERGGEREREREKYLQNPKNGVIMLQQSGQSH